MILPLQHHFGLAEALFHVAQLVLDVAGDIAPCPGVLAASEPLLLEVGGQGFVDHGRVGPHSVLEGQHRLQHLVVYVNEGQGLLGDVGAGGGDGGHGVALVEGLMVGHDVLGHQPHVALGFSQVNDLVLNNREVLGRDCGQHAGQGLGLAGVYRPDAGVGVGAAQHLAVEHPGQLDVGPILGGAGDLLYPVVADWPSAYDFVIAAGALLGGGHSYLRRVGIPVGWEPETVCSL